MSPRTRANVIQWGFGIQAKMQVRTVCREIARSMLTGETRALCDQGVDFMRPTDIGVPH
jgi:hypothetical protein